MKHTCKIKHENAPETFLRKAQRKVQEFIMVSPTNPLRLDHFKSESSVKHEHERHLRISRYVIHPFSQFRGLYEIFLIFLYTAILVIKPINFFLGPEHFEMNISHRNLSITVNLLCYMDIIMTFFTGFIKQTPEANVIELRFRNIAKHYVIGPYFICDVLSSLPKAIFYCDLLIEIRLTHFTLAMMDIFIVLKLIRLISLFSFIYRSAQYLNIKSKTLPFLVCVFTMTLIVSHWAGCIQFGVAKVSVYLSDDPTKRTWYHKAGLDNSYLFTRYSHSFLKGTSYLLGIWVPLYEMELTEEYAVALITYIVGKFLVVFVWLILALAILNSRSVDFKFVEVINQLDEYMKRKRLPLNLRDRITQLYDFKFQRKYFKEEAINNALPEHIKRDVKVHVCRTMIESVSIFSDLTTEEISNLVEYLIPEVYLPQDLIIQSGTKGDAMYFLSSGTVAVYSHSGKEICHLQDGAYFGEIALLVPDQSRSTTIIAIEITQIYKLKKKDFEHCLLQNKKVLEKLMEAVEVRLSEALSVEEQYKKLMFEKTFTFT